MSLVLNGTSSALSPGLQASFGASGGVEPYVYSVVAGGPGGSIDADSGLYTAPVNATGVETILVTDDDSVTATATISVCTPLELVCDILKTELSLASDQVYLWDQKVNIPKDSRLYVVVGILNCKPFGNTLRPSSSGGGMDGTGSVNMLANLSIDIFSRGPAARDRKEEIVLALGSNYAEKQQEFNAFYIARLTNGFVNLSEIEGAAILYRFNISVNIQYMFRKVKPIDYFDDFSAVEVTTEP